MAVAENARVNEANSPASSGQSTLDISTVAGLVLGFGAVLLSVILEGGKLGSLVNIPAGVLVIGGTMGVSVLCYPVAILKELPGVIRTAFLSKSADPFTLIDTMTALGRKARQEGVLGLESDPRVMSDKLLAIGVQLVVDGTDTDKIRSILESELENMAERHEAGAGFFESAGGYAPTMGIIGTVIGLVNVLGGLAAADMGQLGHAIAGAFTATLYGVGSANLLFLPMASKLRNKSRMELTHNRMVIEGVLAIQAGEHPNVIQQRMAAFLKPSDRVRLQKG